LSGSLPKRITRARKRLEGGIDGLGVHARY
jgi:hypothetical protein